MEIKEIQPEDWQEFKRIRLQALQESPFAFGRAYEEESAYDDIYWEERVKLYNQDPNTIFLLCFKKPFAVAMAGCFRDKTKCGVSQIYSLWLNPDLRGGIIADQILLFLEKWSLDNGMSVIEGFVTENNIRARAFYRKQGFIETSERQNFSRDPSIEEILIRKEL